MERSHGWEIWVLLICINATSGFYHQPSRKYITYTNLPNDAYFGYSIAYQANIRRLIVGAPKANVVGSVYTVNIDSEAITQIDTPKNLIDDWQKTKTNVTSHSNFLYGATVKAGSNSYVTCAPKHALIFTIKTGNTPISKTVVLGLCFNHPFEGPPRVLDGEQPKLDRIMLPYGWSLDITKTNDMIIGGPGFYQGFVRVNKNNGYEALKPNGVDYSFGYSVASGNYFDEKDITSLYYAVSTPYGITGAGKVLFFDAKTRKPVNKYTIYDSNVGSLFGASLCTVSLGERRDHLLVGAPTYSEGNDIDSGAVHLYVANNKKFNLYKTIESPSTVYFGYSLANLRDLDGDFKDEVAIGAPYENEGRGAVYIYSGAALIDSNKQGNQMMIQKITPEPKDGIISFGSSLTFIQDYDENGCNELAVGAPETNSVVVYHCFAYITIKLHAKFPTKVQSNEAEKEDKLIFQSCFDVIFPKKPATISEKIRMQVKVSHQDVWFWTGNDMKSKTNTMAYEVRVTKEKTTYCADVEVVVRKKRSSGNGGSMLEIMTYTIKASLMDDARNNTDFISNRVLLSEQSSLFLSGQESLADCQGDNCEPKLELSFKSEMKNFYIVGSTSEGSFSFSITNEGATAYTPCLVVDIKGAPLLRLPQGCVTENRKKLTCTPIYLLKKGVDWETGKITLDTRDLTSKDEEIKVSYDLYTRCKNITSLVPSQPQVYHLISSTDGIQVERESEPGDVVDIFSESSRIRHVYTILNPGPTTWEGVDIDLVLEKKKNVVTYENIIVEIEDESKVICEISETNIGKELSAHCSNIDLQKPKKVKVIVPFVVTPIESKNAVETQNVSTSLILHLKSDTKVSNATTQLVFKKSIVPLWIILTASLLGLFILILLGYALFSLGFLQRKQKGKLVQLKKSVYRQSVHHMSMRNSQRSSSRGARDDAMDQSLIDKHADPTQEIEQSSENEI